MAYRGEADGPPRSTATVETTSTSCTVKSLKCETDYNLTVRINGGWITCFGWGTKSSTNGSTISCPTATAPKGLLVPRTKDSEADLSWTGVTNAAAYRLNRHIGSGSWTQIVTTTPARATRPRGWSATRPMSARGDGHPCSTRYGDPSSVQSSLEICIPVPAPTGLAVTRPANDDSNANPSWSRVCLRTGCSPGSASWVERSFLQRRPGLHSMTSVCSGVASMRGASGCPWREAARLRAGGTGAVSGGLRAGRRRRPRWRWRRRPAGAAT